MQKPNSLRQRLIAAFPELERDPERLLVFADEGRVITTGTPSRSFELAYTLNMILTDFGGDPNAVMLAVVDWVNSNQPELLANPDQRRDAIQFEADIVSHTQCDLSLKLPLTERVLATHVDGRWITTDTTEPPPVESDWQSMFTHRHE
ncbi:phage tail protein [Silvimonas sp.]|uniref:phage tail protein n=1 Tax=Silvimonas sp. TaxID=2650811 RepID=UPI0028505C5E|nr:phage tail protein [Silvimonas sp.]MDR3429681.1 phage tail protein [Silvimonas sp.]